MIVEEREAFEREYGCTEGEWRGWMPAATGAIGAIGAIGATGASGEMSTTSAPLAAEDGAQALRVPVGKGELRLRWQVLEPRVIALMRLPRLAVAFAFEGVPLAERREFMRRFDMHLQRGGG